MLLAPFAVAFVAASRILPCRRGRLDLARLWGWRWHSHRHADRHPPALQSEEFRFLLDLTLKLLPLVMASYFAWQRYRAGADPQLVAGTWLAIAVLIGIVTFSFALVFEIKGELRTVLVNINRDWVDVVTFDHRKELMTGVLISAGDSDEWLHRGHISSDPGRAAARAALWAGRHLAGRRFR